MAKESKKRKVQNAKRAAKMLAMFQAAFKKAIKHT